MHELRRIRNREKRSFFKVRSIKLKNGDVQVKALFTSKMKTQGKAGVQQILVSFSATVFALVLGMLLIYAIGFDPFSAAVSMVEGAFGSKNAFGETLVKMTPLIFTGMSYALASRCGLTNLGMEGQLYMGALAGTATGIYVAGLPAALHLPLTILAGFIGGGLWGLIAGTLKVRFGASEIITTVMLNTIAISFIDYMVNGPMIEPPGINCQTQPVRSSAQLPTLISGTRAHWGFVIAIAFVVLFWLFLWRSKRGYEVRVAGLNLSAARYSGIHTNRNILLVMFLAGGLAGLAGCNEILGIQIRMIPEISPGYGFDGIAVSLIGNNTPFGIVIGALLFGAFRAGGNRMQIRAKVPNAIVSVVQALVIFAVVASQMLLDKWNEHQMKKINRQESEVA